MGVVLAAGRSERLSGLTKGRSKALVQLGGMPLVERAVRTLLDAGVERVYVVVGHQAEEVAAAARLAPGDVRVIRAAGWEAGNGASLAAAEREVAGEDLFAVLCADHVFADGVIAPFLDAEEPAVLVDPSPSDGAWEEGTRVHVKGDRALAFAKSLQDREIDCGVFVLSHEVFRAHRLAAAEGDHSLAAAVTRLGETRPLRAFALRPDRWWQDVDTPADLRAAKNLVRRSLRKESDGPISRYLNRPISTRITMALAPLRLSPSLVSFLTFLVGVWAAWSLSAGRALVGGLLAQASSVLDGVDGETARLHGRASPRGAFLDMVYDRMIDAAIVAGLWLWAWDDPSRKFRVAIILASAIGWGLIALALRQPISHLDQHPDEKEWPLGVLLGGRDGRMLLIALGSLANQPATTFWVGCVVYCGGGLWRLLLFYRKRSRSPAPLASPDEVGHAP